MCEIEIAVEVRAMSKNIKLGANPRQRNEAGAKEIRRKRGDGKKRRKKKGPY